MPSVTFFLPLLSSLISLYLFAYVMGQRRKSTLNARYAQFSFVIFITCMVEFHLGMPFFPKSSFIALTTVALSLTLLLSWFFLKFIYALVRKPYDAAYRLISIVIFVTAAQPLVFYNRFFTVIRTSAGHAFQSTLMMIPAFLAGALIPGIWGMLILMRRLTAEKKSISTKQMNLVFHGVVFSLFYETALFLVFPFFFGLHTVNRFSSAGLLILSFFIYRAIRKYNLFSVDIDQIQSISRHVFENVKEAVLLFDKDGNLVQANNAAISMFSPDGKTIATDCLEQCIADYGFNREYTNYKTTCTCHNKNYMVVISQSLITQTDRVLAKIVIIHDVTEQSRIERELEKINRIESLGILAGGIAHDFNNYLTGMLTSFGLLKSENGLSPDSMQIVKEGESAARQASQLTRQLLTFSKGDMPDMGTHRVEEILQEVLSFTLRGSKTQYRLQLPDTLKPVFADRTQIAQVFQNLIINADQAMPGGGLLTITGETVTVEKGESFTLLPGEYTAISFTDEGVGIPDSIVDKIFDPYFTTKPKGNGLGLTTAYSIINKHGGHINVSSKAGKGTTFMIFLKTASAQETTKKAPDRLLFKGSGKVLVMDDEPVIRLLLKRILTGLGFTVDLAENGDAALALYDQSAAANAQYAAVITDLTVPGGMGGKELGEELLKRDPSLKIVIASGYSFDPIITNFRDYKFSGAIKKPYSIDEISGVLSEVMKN